MNHIRSRRSLGTVASLGLIGVLITFAALPAADPRPADRSPPPPPKADIGGFKAPQTDETAKMEFLGDAAATVHEGYLGVSIEVDAKGRLTVQAIAPDSPALKCGVQIGDVLTRADGKTVASPAELRKLIQAKSAGDKLKLSLRRKDKSIDVAAELIALGDVGRKPPEQRAVLGVRVSEPRSGDGERIDEFSPDSPAEKAGLKIGDVLLKVDGAAITGSTKLADVLADKKPADTVKIAVLRGAEMAAAGLACGAGRRSSSLAFSKWPSSGSSFPT
jgi:S1-C subfamily serine protease